MAKLPKINVNLHIGERLRARRVALGLSQQAAGKAVGIASQQVQKYEKGINAMNAKRLYEFALLLKVPVAFFFEGLPPTGSASPWEVTIEKLPGGTKVASDRESLEVLKSFKRIKDYALRKRLADLLRSLSLKNV